MSPQAHICVFCGSSRGAHDHFQRETRRVGRALVRERAGLVYGGGRIGLMGVLADEVLANKGRVVGIIPEPLAIKEVAHEGATELLVVPGMHERKALMAQRSDAFLTLPGGIGTLEEFFEVLTWAALGLHNKPIGILNIEGYFDPLLHLLEHAVAAGFVQRRHLGLLLVSEDPDHIVGELLRSQPPPPGPLWIDLSQT